MQQAIDLVGGSGALERGLGGRALGRVAQDRDHGAYPVCPTGRVGAATPAAPAPAGRTPRRARTAASVPPARRTAQGRTPAPWQDSAAASRSSLRHSARTDWRRIAMGESGSLASASSASSSAALLAPTAPSKWECCNRISVSSGVAASPTRNASSASTQRLRSTSSQACTACTSPDIAVSRASAANARSAQATDAAASDGTASASSVHAQASAIWARRKPGSAATDRSSSDFARRSPSSPRRASCWRPCR